MWRILGGFLDLVECARLFRICAGTQGDVRTSWLELWHGGSRVEETGGQLLRPRPSAGSGILVILSRRRRR